MDTFKKEFTTPRNNNSRKKPFSHGNYFYPPTNKRKLNWWKKIASFLYDKNKRDYDDQFIGGGVYGANDKKPSHFSWKKILGLSAAIIAIILLAGGGFFFWKIHAVSNAVRIENNSGQSFVKDTENLMASIITPKRSALRGEEDGRINILLLGAAGKGKPGQNLTDTVMIMSIDTKNKKMGLLSLPRDLYVKIPETNYSTKINSLYQYGLNNDQGLDPIKKSVSEITGLDINYFVVVEFDGFKKIIDDVGGINVMVERDIYDPSYPGPNYSYETFELSKGSHLLDGATALKYVRERHDDPEGDFGRAKRQQQVIQSAKNKIFSLGTFLNVPRINNLLDTLSGSVKTDIEISEIESFIGLAKEIDTQNIANAVADAWKKESPLKVSHVMTGSGMAFILVPRVGNYSEIHDLAKNIFDLDAITRRKNEIKNEKASVIIFNRSDDPQLGYKIKNLIQDRLGIKNVALAHEKNAPLAGSTTIAARSGTEKIFTLDELLKKIPATLNQEKSGILEEDADFAVFIGSDVEKTYSPEEDSVDDWKKSNEDDQKYFQPITN